MSDERRDQIEMEGFLWSLWAAATHLQARFGQQTT